jgi:ATP-dependent DNA helicase DinG
MFNLDEIDNHFPLKSYRPLQKTAIEKCLKAFNDGVKFVFLEAPTGSGKSAIGFTMAQMAQNAYYICPQKFLQDQLSTDFGDVGKHVGDHWPMVELKGRNAYPCNYWERALQDEDFEWGKTESEMNEKRTRYLDLAQQRLGCDKGQCKRGGKSKLPYCENHCPYLNQMNKAKASKICLMNFHSFLFQTAVIPNFQPRELLIIDEAHNTEDVLLKFVEMKISDRHFGNMGIRFPKFETVSEYLQYFIEIKLEDIIVEKIKWAKAQLDTREEDEWKNQLLRYKLLLEAKPEEWVCIWEEVESKASRTITIKPIFVDKFANQYLFSGAKHVLFLSATILSKEAMCSALGIGADSKLFRLNSSFPVQNRPMYFRPSGSMSFKNKAMTLPKMLEDVIQIARHHQEERGIIHTHNFEILNYIWNNAPVDVKARLLQQKDIEFENNKQLMLDKHKRSLNSIIIAPAMHEGLDLKDDLGRFQIICKVPYPSKNDPQIAARMEISSEYYNWRAATKLTQQYGRIYRHEGDYGTTYVLDADFKRFIESAERMLPGWFKEAIVWKS